MKKLSNSHYGFFIRRGSGKDALSTRLFTKKDGKSGKEKRLWSEGKAFPFQNENSWKKLYLLFLLFVPFLLWSENEVVKTNYSAEEARALVVQKAREYLGVPYVFAGTSKKGVDCSGLVYAAYRDAFKVKLPRGTNHMYKYGIAVKYKELLPGDIVFFNTVADRISHAGLYIGKQKFIHAASAGPRLGVIVSSFTERYYSSRYVGARSYLSRQSSPENKEAENKVDDPPIPEEQENKDLPESRLDISREKIRGTWQGDKIISKIKIFSDGTIMARCKNETLIELDYIQKENYFILRPRKAQDRDFLLNFYPSKYMEIMQSKAKTPYWILYMTDKNILRGKIIFTSYKEKDGKINLLQHNDSRKIIWKRN